MEIRTRPKQPRYSFTADTPERLAEIVGDVDFSMYLVDAQGMKTDPTVAKERIDGLTENVGYCSYNYTASTLCAKTDRATYERLFQTQIEQDHSNAGMIGYSTAGYKYQVSAVQIPELSDIIKVAYITCRRV